MKRRLLIILGVLILVSLLTAIIFRQKAAAPENKKVTQTTKADIKETPPATTAPQAKPVPAFNKQAYSQTDPNSIWVIVNKKTPSSRRLYTQRYIFVWTQSRSQQCAPIT
jgi:hypothetical protein